MRLAVAAPPAWTEHAACRGNPPDWWYPHPSENAHEALAICRGCTVRRECREAGREERHGIWGGRRHREA